MAGKLTDGFQRVLDEIANDPTIDRSRAIIITREESYKIYKEINAEMREYRREFNLKNFRSEREASNILIL